jgi:acyl-CoA thioesterase-1
VTIEREAGSSRALRYVALGDSYTIGTSVDMHERWPDQLVRSLGDPSPFELAANLAVNGYTSSDVIHRELPAIAQLQPEFVTVLVGVNDVVQGVPIAAYDANAAAILDRLGQRLPSDRILTVAVPDYTVTPAGADFGDPARQRAAIVAVNAIMARLSAARGVRFVDIFDISERASQDRSLVSGDGLHPSGAQYALWVERIRPVILDLISERSA